MAVVSEPVGIEQPSAPAPIPATCIGSPPPLGLYAFAITTFRLGMVNANLALFLLLVTFLLLGIGNSGAHTTVIHWGGYVGLATAAGAAYVGLVEVLSEMYGRSILPRRQL